MYGSIFTSDKVMNHYQQVQTRPYLPAGFFALGLFPQSVPGFERTNSAVRVRGEERGDTAGAVAHYGGMSGKRGGH